MHDLLIRNVNLCDGLGSALWQGELAVKQCSIAAIGQSLGAARESVDGEGMVLAPGWVQLASTPGSRMKIAFERREARGIACARHAAAGVLRRNAVRG